MHVYDICDAYMIADRVMLYYYSIIFTVNYIMQVIKIFPK